MTIADYSEAPSRLEGKYKAIVICWILGLGSLVSWNSMLTIGDYYYSLFPRYHPSRVLPLMYQPFSLGTIAILVYNESKIDTRKRNLAGYILSFTCTLSLLLLDLVTSSGKGLGAYAVVLIAMYNVWDMVSRYIPLIKWLKLESRKGLMIAILSRFLLVPAFYFTAKYGAQGWMIFLTSFLGLSNGYLTVCVLTTAPKGYNMK